MFSSRFYTHSNLVFNCHLLFKVLNSGIFPGCVYHASWPCISHMNFTLPVHALLVTYHSLLECHKSKVVWRWNTSTFTLRALSWNPIFSHSSSGFNLSIMASSLQVQTSFPIPVYLSDVVAHSSFLCFTSFVPVNQCREEFLASCSNASFQSVLQQ